LAIFAEYQRFDDAGCLPGGESFAINTPRPILTFNPITFRASMFDALYRVDFRTSGVIASFTGIPAMVYPVADSAPEGIAKEYLTMMALGDCVARASPVEAHALMVLDAGDTAETGALRALVPAFQACVPIGVELKMSLARVRGALGEPLYRLTEAVQGAR
jgi:hypothetical protein